MATRLDPNNRRWRGEQTYRVLSYYFSVRWDLGNGAATYLRRVLGSFEVPPDPAEVRNPPTPGLPAVYSLVERAGSADRRYGLYYGDVEMISGAEPSVPLVHLFWHVNSETIRRTGDYFLIHAGVVVLADGRSILLPAASGSGKTTLVAGLVRAGLAYFSDEAAAVDPVTRRIFPYPKAMTFKQPVRQLFPDLRVRRSRYADGHWHLRAEDIGGRSATGSCEAAFVVAPHYRAGAATRVEPMSRAETAMELARNAVNLRTYRSRGLVLVRDLAERTRGYRLESGSLPEAVDAVLALAGIRPQPR